MPDEDISFEEYRRRLDEEMAKHNEFLTNDGRLKYNIAGQRVQYEDGDPRFAEDFVRPFKATDWGVPPHNPFDFFTPNPNTRWDAKSDPLDDLLNAAYGKRREVIIAPKTDDGAYVITRVGPPRA